MDTRMFTIDPRLSVAPMMNWTDRHCRVFHRLLSKNTLLYSEMITTGAIIYGDRGRLLKFSEIERPLALQLGGSDPVELSNASEIGLDFGYNEINLNVGCPSPRVQSGQFGAILMESPTLVASCVSQMKKRVKDSKITVKCRLGVDNQNPEAVLPEFLNTLIDAGVDGIIIHARKAILNGLSPKDNRNIPVLNYELVKQMKVKFPQTEIVINGGIDSLGRARQFIRDGLDGAMIGRAAYHNPQEILLHADTEIFDQNHPTKSMKNVLLDLCDYIEGELSEGSRLNEITRHILGAFNGEPGARAFRQVISEQAHIPKAGTEVVRAALDKVSHNSKTN